MNGAEGGIGEVFRGRGSRRLLFPRILEITAVRLVVSATGGRRSGKKFGLEKTYQLLIRGRRGEGKREDKSTEFPKG